MWVEGAAMGASTPGSVVCVVETTLCYHQNHILGGFFAKNSSEVPSQS